MQADGVTPQDTALPTHVHQTMGMLEEIHARHEAGVSLMQRRLEALTWLAGTPTFCALAAICLIGWTVWNIVWRSGGPVPDPGPFDWLEGIGTWAAVLMTSLILATQRRADEFAEVRERLMLELALLAEQKSAKIIELVEQLRQDHPQIADRDDPEALAMARPVDAKAMFDAVDPATPPAVPPPVPPPVPRTE
jgi:uncharacterized membrane protein